MQPSQVSYNVGPRAQVEMVGVGQDERGTQLTELPWRDSFDRGLGAHRGKDWGGDLAVRRMHHAHASPAEGVLFEQFKTKRHDLFPSGALLYHNPSLLTNPTLVKLPQNCYTHRAMSDE